MPSEEQEETAVILKPLSNNFPIEVITKLCQDDREFVGKVSGMLLKSIEESNKLGSTTSELELKRKTNLYELELEDKMKDIEYKKLRHEKDDIFLNEKRELELELLREQIENVERNTDSKKIDKNDFKETISNVLGKDNTEKSNTKIKIENKGNSVENNFEQKSDNENCVKEITDGKKTKPTKYGIRHAICSGNKTIEGKKGMLLIARFLCKSQCHSRVNGRIHTHYIIDCRNCTDYISRVLDKMGVEFVSSKEIKTKHRYNLVIEDLKQKCKKFEIYKKDFVV